MFCCPYDISPRCSVRLHRPSTLAGTNVRSIYSRRLFCKGHYVPIENRGRGLIVKDIQKKTRRAVCPSSSPKQVPVDILCMSWSVCCTKICCKCEPQARGDRWKREAPDFPNPNPRLPSTPMKLRIIKKKRSSHRPRKSSKHGAVFTIRLLDEENKNRR